MGSPTSCPCLDSFGYGPPLKLLCHYLNGLEQGVVWGVNVRHYQLSQYFELYIMFCTPSRQSDVTWQPKELEGYITLPARCTKLIYNEKYCDNDFVTFRLDLPVHSGTSPPFWMTSLPLANELLPKQSCDQNKNMCFKMVVMYNCVRGVHQYL